MIFRIIGWILTIASMAMFYKAKKLNSNPELQNKVESIAIPLALAGLAFAVVNLIKGFT